MDPSELARIVKAAGLEDDLRAMVVKHMQGKHDQREHGRKSGSSKSTSTTSSNSSGVAAATAAVGASAATGAGVQHAARQKRLKQIAKKPLYKRLGDMDGKVVSVKTDEFAPWSQGLGLRLGQDAHNKRLAIHMRDNPDWIKRHPIHVSVFDDGLRVTDGAHRFVAARMLGLKEVPMKVHRAPVGTKMPEASGIIERYHAAKWREKMIQQKPESLPTNLSGPSALTRAINEAAEKSGRMRSIRMTRVAKMLFPDISKSIEADVEMYAEVLKCLEIREEVSKHLPGQHDQSDHKRAAVGSAAVAAGAKISSRRVGDSKGTKKWRKQGMTRAADDAVRGRKMRRYGLAMAAMTAAGANAKMFMDHDDAREQAEHQRKIEEAKRNFEAYLAYKQEGLESAREGKQAWDNRVPDVRDDRVRRQLEK